MVHINVSNSLSQIKNHSDELHEELTKTLRFMDQTVEYGYRSVIYKIKKINTLLGSQLNVDKASLQRELKHLLHVCRGIEDKLWRPLYDSEGYFPTGLLPKVLAILENRKTEVEVIDNRKKPETEFKFVLKESLPPFRYPQKIAVKYALEQHRGVIVLPTGVGKTKAACKIVQELGVTTLVVVPSKSILDLMVNDFVKHFGKGKVQKLNTKNFKLKAINVINIQALVNIDPKHFASVKAVVFDEFHHAASDTYLEANEEHLKDCYYRIGLTATNFRNDGADLALEAVLSNVLYEYPVKQAISDKFLMQPHFEIIPIKLGSERTFQKAYKTQIVENVERNRLVKDVAEHHKKDSVLILVKQIEHGEELQKLIPGSEFVRGDTKDGDREKTLEAFRKGQLKCLIGTTVIGEGVDLPIANVLIMAGGGKSRIQVMQNIGRALRLAENKPEPLIYDFTDTDDSWLEEHSDARSEIYEIYKP